MRELETSTCAELQLEQACKPMIAEYLEGSAQYSTYNDDSGTGAPHPRADPSGPQAQFRSPPHTSVVPIHFLLPCTSFPSDSAPTASNPLPQATSSQACREPAGQHDSGGVEWAVVSGAGNTSQCVNQIHPLV